MTMDTNGTGPTVADEPTPTSVASEKTVPSEKTRQKFVTSVHNSANQTKRGLLDFLDFQEQVLMKDPKLAPIYEQIESVFAYSRRRVHNDISTMRDQVLACFQIYVNGGEIPAFGRSEEEQRRSLQRPQKVQG